jgi:aminopeptidase
MATSYTPSPLVLKRYADVLVKFALGGGTGVKKGEVVYINASEVAKPLLFALQNAITESGGHFITNYRPDNDKQYNFSANFLSKASDEQLDFFADKYYRGLVDQADHLLSIHGDVDPNALAKVDPKKILRRGKAMKRFSDWRRDKEHQGKFTWTLALYGTEAMAKEARMPLKEYWEQIIKACFLDKKDPIAEWKRVFKGIDEYSGKLNKLTPKINKLHIKGIDEDLWITPGKSRQWVGGSGRNIPSFEIFTSPDWRGTEGWVRFNQPLYRYGNKVTGIELWFKGGKVIKCKAKTGEKLLKEMIATPGADRVGEFSLTDGRYSRITKFMADTLYDENMGGPQGNTHIALGSAYAECYSGDVSKLTPKQKVDLGFNDSSVHTDIISTAKRTVTAHLHDGSEVVIYDNGQFTL